MVLNILKQQHIVLMILLLPYLMSIGRVVIQKAKEFFIIIKSSAGVNIIQTII